MIPVATKKRYPIYLRTLRNLYNRGMKRIKSDVIAYEMGIRSTTVRRDLSYLGALGRQGYGYDIQHLIQAFASEVEVDEHHEIVLFGLGNMGKALLKYNYLPLHVGEIVAIFETDFSKIGIYDGFPVYHLSEMDTKWPAKAQIAILACPGNNLQLLVDKLTKKGIKAIVNFSDAKLKVKPRVILNNFDLGQIIQDSVYQVKNMV